MPAPEVAIFDLDGTLVDAYEAIHLALDETLLRMGLPGVSCDEVRRSVGGGDLALVSRYVPAARVDEARAAYRARHLVHLPRRARLMPGAKEMLQFLHDRKIRIAAATNRSRTTALPLLAHTGIAQFFDLVVAAEDSERLKPDPAQILLILSRFSCPPQSAVFVGDMVVDLQAGLQAGVHTFIVLTGSSSREEFGDAGAHLCDTLAQVRARVERLIGADGRQARRKTVDNP